MLEIVVSWQLALSGHHLQGGARYSSMLFSKVSMTLIGDTFWGSANFKPRQRTSFWKKDSSYEEMFMICSSISVSLYNNLAILQVWVLITSC